MASLVKDLVEAGIHFGHRSTNWNPKMEPYIFGKRNKIHVIDVKATIKGLLLARKFLTRTVSRGGDVLFVGTKRQARESIERHVTETGMHYVTERWLGGTLTNFQTIRERLKRLEELEEIESSGQIDNYSKKMESQLRREKRKILANLGGIRNMNKLPSVMVVIDANHETNALKEARKLGIPTICLIDTDSDPAYADIPIPGNDDSIRAIDAIVQNLCAAVMEGKSARAAEQVGKEEQKAKDRENEQAEAAGTGRPRRRSARAQWRADEGQGVAVSGDDPEAPEAEAGSEAVPEAPEAEAGAEAAPEAPGEGGSSSASPDAEAPEAKSEAVAGPAASPEAPAEPAPDKSAPSQG